jgi:hypothetical protein
MLSIIIDNNAFAFPPPVAHTKKPGSRRLSTNVEQHVETDTSSTCILSALEAHGLSVANRKRIVDNLQRVGLWQDDASSQDLMLLAQDFVDRPEVFSSLLINDFDFPPLVAHQTRALAMAILKEKDDADNKEASTDDNQNVDNSSSQMISGMKTNELMVGTNGTVLNGNSTKQLFSAKDFRSTVVNEKQKRRKQSVDNFEYGLPKDYANIYPRLASELNQGFYEFMIKPSTHSQEDPIRPATAKIYMTHARLFLGWCVQGGHQDCLSADPASVSIYDIIPSKEKESADIVIEFVLFLRSRDVSISYEANLLRGITKLLKFRFAKESESDPMDGKNTFDDIPVIREVRKLHRDANKRQKLAPRSSDEQKKWISWKEYIDVIENAKNEALDLMHEYHQTPFETLPPFKQKAAEGKKRRIADAYIRYLILAIFASIPDRQRTIRELEIGRTLVKDGATGFWTIRHGPEDYKTGKHYGERPAIQLAQELTPAIDDFIENWRPSLKPSSNFLLVQSRTGKPLTADSIFQRVVRACFKYTGKRVNPHLLRDIIVTHVRETDASEKELEALALYMGHSIQMQRTSYDRRTLTAKIAPALRLMESVNSKANK